MVFLRCGSQHGISRYCDDGIFDCSDCKYRGGNFNRQLQETTDRWLNERLAADLYVYSSPSSQKEMTDWLVQQDAVQSLWKRWERDIPSDQGLLQIVSTGKSSGELNTLTVKVAVPNFWELLHTQRSIMISESMSLKLDILLGMLFSYLRHWD